MVLWSAFCSSYFVFLSVSISIWARIENINALFIGGASFYYTFVTCITGTIWSIYFLSGNLAMATPTPFNKKDEWYPDFRCSASFWNRTMGSIYWKNALDSFRTFLCTWDVTGLPFILIFSNQWSDLNSRNVQKSKLKTGRIMFTIIRQCWENCHSAS